MSQSNKRGPYKQYLSKDRDTNIPRRTKYRYRKKFHFVDNNKDVSCETNKLCKYITSSSSSESSSDEFLNHDDPPQNDPSNIDCHVEQGRFNENDIIYESIEAQDDDLASDFLSPPSSPEHLEELESSDNEVEAEGYDNIHLTPVSEEMNLMINEFPKKVLLRTLLVLAGKIRHNLTYSAAEDFAKLIDIEAKDVVGCTTKYYTQKIVDKFSFSMKIQHFCPSCNLYAGAETGVTADIDNANKILLCEKCNFNIDVLKNRQLGNIFLYLSLADQLKHFYEKNHTEILYSNSRKKLSPYCFEDIFDGEHYKNKIKNNDGNDIISVNFSVDGTPLFKASHTSVTPILCSINELPPTQQRQQTMLVSIFLGSKKVDKNEYLKPFVAEAKLLATQGFKYTFNNCEYVKKCKILTGVVDSVERPDLRCTFSFRGRFGCGFCLNEGIEVQKGRGHVRVYPIDKYNNAYGEGLRNHEDTMNHAKNNDKGVKRRSILCDIPDFDIIKGLCVDWMHSVALGVCRQFASLWFDSTNHNEKFYFQRFLPEIDLYLRSIKASNDISRIPREMTERQHWKAHEWVYWLIFYSLPILKKLFPREYTDHWSLLVDAISTLLQKSLSETEIYSAQRQLFQFVKDVETYYGKQHISFNVHLLTHLTQSCLDLGPLWTHSAFRYEDYHQELKKFVNSSNAANLQILHSFQAKIACEKLYQLYRNDLKFSERKWIEKLMNKKKNPLPSLEVNNISFFGKPEEFQLMPIKDYLALQRLNITADQGSTIKYYKRILKNREMIVSKSYTKITKRNSYTVLLTDGQVFEIEMFIVIEILGIKECYALGTYFEKCSNTLFPGKRLKHLTITRKIDSFAAVAVNKFKEKVVMIKFPSEDSLFLACSHPNRYEMLN